VNPLFLTIVLPSLSHSRCSTFPVAFPEKCYFTVNIRDQGLNFIAAIVAIAVEGEQNAVDHCGNDSNFLPYSITFILFIVHYYFDT
jgi:hypothetical protein